ncbi:MAG: hypothetical protein A2W11_01345 [Ignavibacteria bacterium RBG_16_35_7]|nr:MAG: hypothetical protein A2W11_01345 [Ignavibacteria bacterium RBG_16_35_7]
MKTLFTFLVLTFFLTTAQAQDIDATLGGNTSTEGFSVKDNGGNNLFRVTGDGRVGVGTTSPGAGLELNNAGGYGSALSLNNTGGGTEWRITSWTDGNLRFVKIPGSTFTAMQMEPINGWVGIGTTPTCNLHLRHDQFVPGGGLRLEQSFTGSEWLLYTSQSVNDLRLFFNGVAKGEFDDVTGNYTAVSDERLKKNIEPVESVLDKINSLQPRKYNMKEEVNTAEKHYGFIAQELEKIFPELVSVTPDDGDGIADLRTVSYTELIPILVKAVQEQQKLIEELQRAVNK